MKECGSSRLYVCATELHVLQSLIDIISSEVDGYIYITNNIPANESRLSELAELSNNVEGVKATFFRQRRRFGEITKIETLKDHSEWNQFTKIIGRAFTTVLFTWNLESVYKKGQYIFQNSHKVILVEDGAMVYKRPKDSTFRRLIKKFFFGIDYGFARDSKIERVYVTKVDKFSGVFKNSEVRPIEQFVNTRNLSDADVSNILKVFVSQDTTKQIESIRHLSGPNVIVFTQPMYLFNGISKEKQISIYENLFNKYEKKQYRIIVKRHPSDKLNYKIPSDAIIFDDPFPSEILSAVNIHFDVAVGVCTSAVVTVNAQERINVCDSIEEIRELADES